MRKARSMKGRALFIVFYAFCVLSEMRGRGIGVK